MKHRRCFAALAAAAFLLSTQALAEPTAEDRATARILAAEAHRAFDAKDYATAADRFAKADALVHAPTLMLGLARSQEALGKIVAANESLNRILREDLPPNAPKVWTDALDEARKELTLVQPRLSWITVNLKGATGHEDRVKLTVDGVQVPKAAFGLPREVDKGQHVVAATVDYGKGASATVTLDEGKQQAVTLEVKLEAPPAKPPPVAQVGPAAQGGPVAPPPPPAPVSPLRRNVGIASLGVGAAGLVMGAITGGAVIGMHGSLATACKNGVCPASQSSKLSTYDALGTASTVGFIGGAVLAGLGIVLVVTAPKPQRAQMGLVVTPTTGGGAIGAVGSF